MVFLDYYGYPVEQAKRHWLRNILRRLIHTRRICLGYWDGFGVTRSRKGEGKEKQ